MTTQQIAIDCKDEFLLTAIVHCTVHGVLYAPGQTFRTDRNSRDYLVKTGAVMDESTDPVAEVAPAAPVQVAAKPQHKRVTRRK